MSDAARGAPRKLLELFVPVRLLSINAERRMHYMARSEYVSDVVRITQEACVVAGLHRTKITVPVVAVFQPVQTSGVLADAANHLPTCKAILDAIERMGIIKGDDPQHVIEQAFLAPRRGTTAGCHIRLEAG